MNIKENTNIHNIKFHKIALSNFNGKERIRIRSSYKLESPAIEEKELHNYQKKAEEFAKEELIEFRTLDSYNLNKCDFTKIDVDGSEIKVLEGAIKTIRKFRPIIILECHRDNFSKLNKLLKPLNYKIKGITKKENFFNLICKEMKGGNRKMSEESQEFDEQLIKEY